MMSGNFLNDLFNQLDQEKSKNTLIKCIGLGNATIEPMLHVEKFFPKMREWIATEDHEVLIKFYRIEKDSSGEKELIAALSELSEKALRENKKIRVRIICNKKSALVELLYTKTGVPTTFRDSTARDNLLQKFTGLDFQFADFDQRAFGSSHAKMIIVSNKAMLISADLSLKCSYPPTVNHAPWIDLASCVEGDIVKVMRQDFVDTWNSPLVKTLGSEKTLLADNETGEEKIEHAPDSVPVLFISKESENNPCKRKYHGPSVTAYLAAIAQATTSIDLVVQNLNNKKILDALIDAVIRGVTVNIILSKHQAEKVEAKPTFGGTNLSTVKYLYEKLRKNHSELFDKLNVRWAINPHTNEVVQDAKPFAIHAKFLRADNIVVTGSSVPDIQSAYFSAECDIVTQSEKVAEKYHTLYNSLLNNSADVYDTRIDPLPVPIPAQVMLSEAELFLKHSIAEIEFIESELAKDPSEKAQLECKILKEALFGTKNNDAGGLYNISNDLISLKSSPKRLLKIEPIVAQVKKYEDICRKTHEKLSPQYHAKTFFARIIEWIKNWFLKFGAAVSTMNKEKNNSHKLLQKFSIYSPKNLDQGDAGNLPKSNDNSIKIPMNLP